MPQEIEIAGERVERKPARNQNTHRQHGQNIQGLQAL